MANEPLTAEGLVAGVLKLRLERDAAIDLLRRLVAHMDEEDGGFVCGIIQAMIREEAPALLATIDGAAPAESEA